MIVTLFMSDGRKITRDENGLHLFDVTNDRYPEPREGVLCVNVAHVMAMRPAKDSEIEHSKIHEW